MTSLIQIPNEIDNEEAEPKHEQKPLLTTIKEEDPATKEIKDNKETQDKTTPENNLFGKLCGSAAIVVFIGFSLADIIIGAMNWGSCEIVSKYIIYCGLLNLFLPCVATAETTNSSVLIIGAKLGFLIAEPIVLFGNYPKEKEHCNPDYLSYAFWHFVVYYSGIGLVILGSFVTPCITPNTNAQKLDTNFITSPTKNTAIEMNPVVVIINKE